MKNRDNQQRTSALTPEEQEDYRRWWEERHPETLDADQARRLELVRREWKE